MYGQSLNQWADFLEYILRFFNFLGDGDYAIHESMGSTVWYIFPDL